MSNFVKQINGAFTVSVDGRVHPNLVVASGLSNVFGDTQVASLCETLKVFNDDTEVQIGDTDYLSPVATSSNVTDTVYGVSGDGNSDYFYMKKTWTFYQGQIQGVINKLAVYSDDGSLYAAALLKNEAGEIDPVRPLFAPKVEITYESRWHFKQDDNYNLGIPVYFSKAGMVIVKTNMADKNNSTFIENMNKPFAITDVELFSDGITTDDTAPSVSLGKVDAQDYTVTHIDGQFNAYGQYLNIVLPKDKYINDTPIASIVITTTRGKWQMGFDPTLEKPTLSKREITLTIPFVHGIVTAAGEFDVTGNPDAINSIFDALVHSTYNISTRTTTYDGVGKVSVSNTVVTPADPDAVPPTKETSEVVTQELSAFFGGIKDKAKELSIIVPATDSVVVAAGTSAELADYLSDNSTGVVIEIKADTLIKVAIDGAPVEVDVAKFVPTTYDLINLSVSGGALTLTIPRTGATYTTAVSTAFVDQPDHLLVGIKDVTQDNDLTIY